MNLNKKITKFTGDGIPAYNQKINELIDAVNWLAGIRAINGKTIAESDQGPIIDLSTVNSTQSPSSPWANDPDGNQAGWLQATILNPNFAGQIPSSGWLNWLWTSDTTKTIQLPWLMDPNGNVARWVVGANGALWGTGDYPGAPSSGNFQQAKTVYTGSVDGFGKINYKSPGQWQSNPANPPIVVPASPPAFYIKTGNLPGGNAPCFNIVTGASSKFPTDTINWDWALIYEGIQVLTYSGSFTGTPSNYSYYAVLDPTGWVYDPGNTPGYSQGSGQWLWKYQGAVSTNTNPQIVQTFTFSSNSGLGSITQLNVIFLTG